MKVNRNTLILFGCIARYDLSSSKFLLVEPSSGGAGRSLRPGYVESGD
jgi:hypothetical protein